MKTKKRRSTFYITGEENPGVILDDVGSCTSTQILVVPFSQNGFYLSPGMWVMWMFRRPILSATFRVNLESPHSG